LAKLKQFLKTRKVVGRRMLSAGPIRKFDRRSDDAGTFARIGLAKGYLKTTIDALLDKPGLTDRMIASGLHVRPDPDKRAYYSWDVPAFLRQSLLRSKTLQDMVTDYLGPRARLHDFYVKSVMDGLSSGSEGWHDDNVGYRLKVVHGVRYGRPAVRHCCRAHGTAAALRGARGG